MRDPDFTQPTLQSLLGPDADDDVPNPAPDLGAPDFNVSDFPERPVTVHTRHRRDGWTAARQQEFLELLADTCSVTEAARRVGLTRQAAYRLRRHPDAGDFRAAWDLAVAQGQQALLQVALERALHGEEEELIRGGEIVGVRRRPCDSRLLIHLLKREDERRRPQLSEAQLLGALRQLIDQLPDRRDWLPDRLEPYQFHELDRVVPPARLIQPDDGGIDLRERRGQRARITPNA